MNHSTRDNHPSTSKATSKDVYPPSDFEPSRHHRSASGYPSGPDYVSTSRRHGEKPSARDHRPRIVSESQPIPPPTSYPRYRDPSYPDAPHIRSSHRKESTIDSAAHTSASKKYAHDSTVYRNNHSAEDVVQYPRMTYERWIPPNLPSPPSHQQVPHNRERGKDDKDRERDNHKLREGYHHERRDENDVKERHKRRHDEGDSEWDKERERRDRRDRERHKEWEKDKSKEQEREKVKEEFVERTREKTAREKARGPERYRDEREQERYAEKERQRAVEKEKGREKERDRERRRQKEREREQGERKDKEKLGVPRLKTGLDRERRKDREVALPERDYWPEVEKGRESDRELDRRKKKVEWEVQREREKARESPDRVGERGDVPVVMQNGRRLKIEHEGAKKVQETSRRYQAAIPVEGGLVPSVVREQDIERAKRSKKDIDSSRQKEHERIHKASEQSETERARYTEKENVPRREYKSHYERTKSGSRPYADRATDSERENPSHREAGVSNIYQRDTVLRGPVEPESTNLAAKSSIVASKHPRDERVPYISANPKTTAPESVPFTDVSRPTTANDGYMGHTVPASRLIDQNSLTTPKHSPILADSPKLDVGVSDARVKQGSSSQRALRRQSKMSYLAPEPVAVLPPSYATYKHGQSHVTAPQAPTNHVFRTDKEDVTRLNPTQGLVDSFPNLLPPMNSAVPTKTDTRVIAPSTTMHRTTSSSQNINGSRPPGRNTVHLSSVHDKANIETSQIISRDARENASPDVQMSIRTVNDSDARQKTNAFLNMPQANVDDNVDSMHQVTSEQITPRPMSRSQIDKLAKHSNHEFGTPMSMSAVAHSIPSTSGATSNATIKTSSKGIVKTPNASAVLVTDPETKVTATERSRIGLQPLPLLEDLKREIGPSPHKLQSSSEIPLHRPPSAAGWINQQESIRDKVSTASNPTGPAAHSAERSVAVEGQLSSAIRRPTTGLFVSKQEGLLSRVHTKTPIPEIASTSTVIHPPSDVPFETFIQRDTTARPTTGLFVSKQEEFSRVHTKTIPEITSISTIKHPPFDLPFETSIQRDTTARPTTGLFISKQEGLFFRVVSHTPSDANGTSNQRDTTARPTTGLFISKQDGLFSRVHTKTPVPEIASTSTVNHPPSDVPFETFVQRDTTASDRRSQPEPTTAPPMDSRSIRESTGPVAFTRPQSSKGLGDENMQNRKSLIDSHRSAGSECVLRGDSYGHVNMPHSQEQPHLESSQSHSPAASLRRNAPVQPPNMHSNVVDFVQGPLKPQTALESSQSHSPAASLRRNVPVQPPNTPSNVVDFVQGPLKPQTALESSQSHSPAASLRRNPPVQPPNTPSNVVDFVQGSLKPQTALESSQSHSPATSLRRNVPVQPPNAPSNVVDFVQGPLKPQTANDSRNFLSSARAGEDIVPVASHPLPPKPIEDVYIRGVPILRQSDIDTPPSTKDFRATARARNDRTIDTGYHTEREAMMSSFHSVSANGTAQVNQLDSTLSSVFQDKHVKSMLHSHHTEHRRSPKTSHQFVDDAAHEGDSLRKQWKEVTADKITQLHAANSSSDVNLLGAKQDKPGASHPTEDKKPVIPHEGLARILDQPLDRHIKKTRASPSTQSSQSGLPREELQTHANEHDRRQPFCGTPRTIPRSSPSMSHNTASPIVKTLNYGINLNNPNTNQENHSKETYHRFNASATEYPHPIYRSSSVYPTVGTSASHVLHEPSKNQAHPPHSLPVHGFLNSSTIEIIHPPDSSPHHGSTLTSHSLMPTAHNQRPSVVTVKNSDPASTKFPHPPNAQAKAQSGGPPTDIAQLHQSKVLRTPDSANDRSVLNEAGHTDHSSHTQESSPGITPAVSLLFSKSMDLHGSLEQKGSIVNPIAISNHPVRVTNNIYSSSPTSQELERHEPRLITPRIQKAELSEEPRKKSHSVDVAKSKPPEEGHKKSVSLDTTKSKSQEPPQIWYPPASYRDSSYEGKTRPQLTSVTEPVAQKNVPTTLSVNDVRGTMGVEQVKPGRKSPNITNMKVYHYLREKRNRTISAMSMEAQDGTAPSTVVGSPTASVISQAPIYVPSPRDPMKAAQDWLTEGIEAAIRAEAQGRRRILRPGIVFDVAEDPPREEQRHRSKRLRPQGKR